MFSIFSFSPKYRPLSQSVTPGGELLLPKEGRTMMGFEKLLLQGIPFTRLALGPETEVQLSDLAGNAVRITPFHSLWHAIYLILVSKTLILLLKFIF
jgi:hypothetical protein